RAGPPEIGNRRRMREALQQRNHDLARHSPGHRHGVNVVTGRRVDRCGCEMEGRGYAVDRVHDAEWSWKCGSPAERPELEAHAMTQARAGAIRRPIRSFVL